MKKKKQAYLVVAYMVKFIISMASSFLGFAKGGAVSKGQPIVVGEQGAELFVPNQQDKLHNLLEELVVDKQQLILILIQ